MVCDFVEVNFDDLIASQPDALALYADVVGIRIGAGRAVHHVLAGEVGLVVVGAAQLAGGGGGLHGHGPPRGRGPRGPGGGRGGGDDPVEGQQVEEAGALLGAEVGGAPASVRRAYSAKAGGLCFDPGTTEN